MSKLQSQPLTQQNTHSTRLQRCIEGFCCVQTLVFYAILAVLPLDQMARVGVNLSRYRKLISRDP